MVPAKPFPAPSELRLPVPSAVPLVASKTLIVTEQTLGSRLRAEADFTIAVAALFHVTVTGMLFFVLDVIVELVAWLAVFWTTFEQAMLPRARTEKPRK
jgi:hypothetical protein